MKSEIKEHSSTYYSIYERRLCPKMDEMEHFPYEFTKPFLLCFNLLKRCNIGFFDDNVPVFKKYWRFFFIFPFVLIHYVSVSVYMSRVFTTEIKISELAFMVPVYLILTQGMFFSVAPCQGIYPNYYI